ncbi:hypothetical protein [Nocardioides mangrovicus]|uniref:hypothetical protein n=1 Tax=Nocardioides mangrovicus TaxID=2478913 RepID=UPI0018E06838|nr:hypothetical protein [Nocardioides mangrovicus]
MQPDILPSEWFGDVEHTHGAIDEALGFANLLIELSCRGRAGDVSVPEPQDGRAR